MNYLLWSRLTWNKHIRTLQTMILILVPGKFQAHFLREIPNGLLLLSKQKASAYYHKKYRL